MFKEKLRAYSIRVLAPLLAGGSRPRVFYSQVTRSPIRFHFRCSFLPSENQQFPCLNIPQVFHFSSVAEVTSEETETLSEKSNSKLTHESVIYALRKLSKTPEKALKFFSWVIENNESKLSGTAYNLMLRILVNEEWIKDFWFVLKEMTFKGYQLNEETYKTLSSCFKTAKMVNEASALKEFYTRQEKGGTDAGVAVAVEILQESDWGEAVQKKLEGDGVLSVTETTVLMILKEIRAHPYRALGFFHWAQHRPGYQHNSITYNAMLRILAREDSIDEFWNMVKEMKEEGFEIDIDTYVKILRQFLKWKLIKEAVELHEMMMAGPYKPSIQDCSILLNYISINETPDLDLVHKVIKNYESSGFSLSKSMYDGLHRSLTALGNFDKAEEIVETMRKAGFEPDNVTHSQIVFGLCKFGRLDEACKVLDDMEVQGCKPDIKTWTILIQGHCFMGEVDKALSCFTKMLEKDLDADADLLEVLVKGLLSKNRVDSAYTLVVEMVERARLKPWQVTYKQLIERLLGGGKLEEAFKVLNLMKCQNYPPYADPFVKYVSKFGSVEDATQYLKALSAKRFPSSSSYRNIFEAFLKEGRFSEAQDLLYKCPHHIRNHSEILRLFGSCKKGEKGTVNSTDDSGNKLVVS
ncbi:pentatricopeptide repeat-containing protein At3g48250, chloroplastic-like [Aristolochia californica]|uniref:pentatricopeptide repeat-containing protein At3g48250, chloroplastic-like n=1 Tax=Aristolochia californica TaxID=171875 RepID=UPI0035D635E5